MKKINSLLSFLLLFSVFALSSCGKGNDTPVDRIVTLLDQATKKTEAIDNVADLSNVKNVISPEDVWNIIRENADYKLSDSDKSKLKKSYNKLVKTAYDKSCEFVPNEQLKKAVKSQLDLMLEAIDQNIDNASTLGEIKAFN